MISLDPAATVTVTPAGTTSFPLMVMIVPSVRVRFIEEDASLTVAGKIGKDTTKVDTTFVMVTVLFPPFWTSFPS